MSQISMAARKLFLVPPKTVIGVLCGWITALVLMHYPMLLSRMHRMQADIGDTRLNNYFLEHTWLWIKLHRGHEIFWNPPFYYPQANTAAYSDLMLGFAPFYWFWRLLGLQPDAAFQCWMLLVTTLNFFTCLAWLRGCCKCGWGGSVVGSIFLAAASPRAMQLGHQQLQWMLFPMLAIISIHQIFCRAIVDAKNINRWWILLGCSIAAQFWGAFYNAWFLIFSLGIGGAVALLIKPIRLHMLGVLQRDVKVIIATGIATAILVWPALLQYLAVRKDVGGHGWNEIVGSMATPCCWLFPGLFNCERVWTSRWIKMPEPTFEAAVCMGLVTCLMAAVGLWSYRRRADVSLFAITGVIIGMACTKFHGHSFWHVIHHFVPGANAIRAPARIALLLTIPASLGLALFVTVFWTHRRALVAISVGVCLLEQTSVLPSYDKQESMDRILPIVAAMPRNAKYFYFEGYHPPDNVCYQIDAMWAGLITGVPTINGYSGARAPEWHLEDDFDTMPDPTGHNPQLRDAASAWEAKWALDPAKITWLRLVAPGRVLVVPSSSDPSLIR